MSIATIAKKLFRPAASTKSSAQVRPMCPGDMPLVLRIERGSFPADSQWGVPDFAPCFALGLSQWAYIAEYRGQLAGYVVAHGLGPAALLVDNLAVAAEFRRLGIGRLLVEEAAARLLKQPPRRLRTVVRESNLDAQLFLRATGWRAVGVARRPWDETAEDGIKFRRWMGLNSSTEK